MNQLPENSLRTTSYLLGLLYTQPEISFRANIHIISHALISAMFYKCRIYHNLLSKSTKLLNIHIYDVGANNYYHKVDLNDIFAGRAKEHNF